MATTLKRHSIALSKEDLEILKYLELEMGESMGQILKRGLFMLYLSKVKNIQD